jgi:hypothetical protein
MADGSTPKNDDEIEAAVARAIGERPVCPHPSSLLGNDFCARCDAAAAMPVILDQLARVRTDTIDQCAESVAATCGCHDYLDGCRYCADSVAAVRGVSHEH